MKRNISLLILIAAVAALLCAPLVAFGQAPDPIDQALNAVRGSVAAERAEAKAKQDALASEVEALKAKVAELSAPAPAYLPDGTDLTPLANGKSDVTLLLRPEGTYKTSGSITPGRNVKISCPGGQATVTAPPGHNHTLFLGTAATINFVVEGVRTPTVSGFWAYMDGSDGFTVRRSSCPDSQLQATLRLNCKNVLIEDSEFYNADKRGAGEPENSAKSAIALQDVNGATVRRTKLGLTPPAALSALTLGPLGANVAADSPYGFNARCRNVVIEDVTVEGARLLIEPGTEDVVIRNVTISAVGPSIVFDPAPNPWGRVIRRIAISKSIGIITTPFGALIKQERPGGEAITVSDCWLIDASGGKWQVPHYGNAAIVLSDRTITFTGNHLPFRPNQWFRDGVVPIIGGPESWLKPTEFPGNSFGPEPTLEQAKAAGAGAR